VPKALTLVEAARWLGISASVLQRLVDAGELPATRVDGVAGVRVNDLQAWIEASQVKPGSLAWARQDLGPRGRPLEKLVGWPFATVRIIVLGVVA